MARVPSAGLRQPAQVNTKAASGVQQQATRLCVTDESRCVCVCSNACAMSRVRRTPEWQSDLVLSAHNVQACVSLTAVLHADQSFGASVAIISYSAA